MRRWSALSARGLATACTMRGNSATAGLVPRAERRAIRKGRETIAGTSSSRSGDLPEGSRGPTARRQLRGRMRPCAGFENRRASSTATSMHSTTDPITIISWRALSLKRLAHLDWSMEATFPTAEAFAEHDERRLMMPSGGNTSLTKPALINTRRGPAEGMPKGSAAEVGGARNRVQLGALEPSYKLPEPRLRPGIFCPRRMFQSDARTPRVVENSGLDAPPLKRLPRAKCEARRSSAACFRALPFPKISAIATVR